MGIKTLSIWKFWIISSNKTALIFPTLEFCLTGISLGVWNTVVTWSRGQISGPSLDLLVLHTENSPNAIDTYSNPTQLLITGARRECELISAESLSNGKLSQGSSSNNTTSSSSAHLTPKKSLATLSSSAFPAVLAERPCLLNSASNSPIQMQKNTKEMNKPQGVISINCVAKL